MVRQSDNDQVTVVGACVTLVEALKAADELASGGINIRVVDPFTVKPIDVDTILHCARQTGGRLVVVEDHYPEGNNSNNNNRTISNACCCNIASHYGAHVPAVTKC